MKIELRFFASVREALGASQEIVDLPDHVKTVGDVRAFLMGRGGLWTEVLGPDKALRMAYDHVMTEPATLIEEGGEVAFFPTGNRRLSEMPLSKEQLDAIADGTLMHYEARARAFREGTRDHDVSQNIRALLDAIGRPAPLTILDFGCGPGRDLQTFSKLGHRAIGLDGAASFVEMAREDSGCEVWHQGFFALDLPAGLFDGVFANASLFHIPAAELPRVLRELRDTLKDDGVLFCSNPRGSNSEGWSNGRYGSYHDLEAWRGFMTAAGFAEIRHYYRPDGLLRAQQAWLATVWSKARRAGQPG